MICDVCCVLPDCKTLPRTIRLPVKTRELLAQELQKGTHHTIGGGSAAAAVTTTATTTMMTATAKAATTAAIL